MNLKLATFFAEMGPRIRRGNELDIYSELSEKDAQLMELLTIMFSMVDGQRARFTPADIIAGWMRMGCVAWRWEYGGACIELATIGMQVLGSFEMPASTAMATKASNFMNRRCLRYARITARFEAEFLSRAHMRLFHELRMRRAYAGDAK